MNTLRGVDMLNYIWAVMIMIGVLYAALTGNLDAVTRAALDSAGEAVSLCLTMAGVVAMWMGLMEIAKKAGLILRMTEGISPFLNFMFPKLPKEHPARGYIATNIIANILGLGWACTPAGLKAMEELAKLERERIQKKAEFVDKAGVTGGKMQDLTVGKVRGVTGGKKQDPAVGKVRGMTQGVTGGKKQDPAVGKLRGMTQGVTGKQAVGASDEMCTFLILNISSLQLIPVNMIAYRSQYGSVNPSVIIAPSIVATLVSTVTAILFCKWKCRGGVRS